MQYSIFDTQNTLERYTQPVDTTAAKMWQLTTELINLEEENILLRLILTSSSDPILITSPDVKITYVNPAWEKLTGYTFEEVEGKDPRILQSGKTPRRVYKKLWNALSKKQSFTTEETIDRRKDGSEYQIYSAFFPVQKNGKTIYYVQIQHDITKRKQLDELHKEFLSAAAHELKTPLTVLKLLSQMHLAKVKKQGNDVIKTGEFELIDKEVDMLTRLVNDILDSSRFETGKLSLNLERLSINSIIKRVAEKIHIYANSHIVIFGDVPKNAVVIADPDRIEQVLLNLISNAVRYSEEKTTLNVGARTKAKFVEFYVKDQGIGIAKAQQKHVFNKYYQAESKKKRSRVGFGLGLYISKEIIKRHKGKVWVESKIGEGSIFFFSLPLFIQ